MQKTSLRFFATSFGLAALLVSAAACSDDAKTASTAATTPTTKTKVTIALDWTPNTNHIGVYAAKAKGWYDAAGLDVEILPYGDTAPEQLVANGKADFGFSYQAGLIYARAGGAPIKQVYANVVKNQYEIAYRESRSDITRPRDLDGKTYAGFGTPDEKPTLSYVIKKDGGTGDFKSVALSAAAYDAVYAGTADFTITVSTWEGIQAGLVGKPLKAFSFSDYGFPNQYSTAIISSESWLKGNTDSARAFVAATHKGYQFAKDNPSAAADLLVKSNPDVLKDPTLVDKSAKTLASDGYFGTSSTPLGKIDAAVWKAYGGFLFSNGLLTGPDGKPLATEPDWSAYYTNEYLPAA
jgi:ABC-type nitrate/sulfonate/bicarbonate transport system substrate-binding protein